VTRCSIHIITKGDEQGTTNLTNVVVSDSLTGDSKNCTTFDSSATCALTVFYTVTTTNVDIGFINNTGKAEVTGH
jgi:hypothetical protein